jgi:hypothetical protein
LRQIDNLGADRDRDVPADRRKTISLQENNLVCRSAAGFGIHQVSDAKRRHLRLRVGWSQDGRQDQEHFQTVHRLSSSVSWPVVAGYSGGCRLTGIEDPAWGSIQDDKSPLRCQTGGGSTGAEEPHLDGLVQQVNHADRQPNGRTEGERSCGGAHLRSAIQLKQRAIPMGGGAVIEE